MTFETYLIDPLKRKTYVTLSEKPFMALRDGHLIHSFPIVVMR